MGGGGGDKADDKIDIVLISANERLRNGMDSNDDDDDDDDDDEDNDDADDDEDVDDVDDHVTCHTTCAWTTVVLYIHLTYSRHHIQAWFMLSYIR